MGVGLLGGLCSGLLILAALVVGAEYLKWKYRP